MYFDDITRKLGHFGKYQRIIYFSICLLQFVSAVNIMGIVFIAAVPEHRCKVPELNNLSLSDEILINITIPLETKDGRLAYSSCQQYVYDQDYDTWGMDDVIRAMEMDRTNLSTTECRNGWTYDDHVYTSTIVSQWDLVCSRRWLKAAVSSVYMAGLMTGVLISGSISDSMGRKPTFVAFLLGSIVTGIAISFSPNYVAFLCLRFSMGFFMVGTFTTSYVIAMELMSPSFRPHAANINNYFWVVALLLYTLMAYYIRDWFTLSLIGSSFITIFLITVFIVPESPRWLYATNKPELAEKIIRKAAKVNKVDLPDELDVIVKSTKPVRIWELCSTPRMACRSANIYYNWFVNCCVYYGLSLNTSSLGGNNFVNFAISGAVEIPSTLLCQLMLHYGGRRIPLAFVMVLGGVALLATIAVPTSLSWLTVTLAMIGKFGIASSFSIIYIFTAELYPTTVRNLAVGSGSFVARIGGIVAPLIAQLSDMNRVIPLVIFGAMSASAGLLALLLPETKDQPLPETLEDSENFGRNQKMVDVESADNPSFPADKSSFTADNPAFTADNSAFTNDKPAFTG